MRIIVVVAAFIILLLVFGCRPKPEATMDNYSFCVGVWCAMRVTHTNLDYLSTNGGSWYHGVLRNARNFSKTNGWPPFSDEIEFVAEPETTVKSSANEK